MKRLILIKQSPAVQLGHLYEHIFCARVDTFLYERHLFPHLDYSLVGKTYYGGIVYIDIELYTDEAIALSDMIPKLAVGINEVVLSTAIRQMIAEKEELFASTGNYNNIEQALDSLHTQPWQNMDDTVLIDTKDIHKKRGVFYIAEGKVRSARKLTTGILLDTEFAKIYRELLPLFRQFAWLITSSLQAVLADTYGYYSLEDAYRNTKKATGVINTFKVAYADDANVELSDTLVTCLEVVHDLQQYGAFERHMEELRKVSHYNNPDLAPNLEKNYEDTGIFIGPKGWQKIATNQNYKLLLKHMSIEVKFGRDKVSRSLVN